MPRRKIIFADGQYYHILNRGVARMPIYYQQAEYQRFIDLIKYYRFADALKSYSNLMLMSKEKRYGIFFRARC